MFHDTLIRLLIVVATSIASRSLFAEPVRLYDPSPDHLWNRLHRALFIRTAVDGAEFGHDLLDPLHWRQTRRFVEGSERIRLVELLGEFNRGGHSLVLDPLSRAILSRDLWAIFDGVTEGLPSVDRATGSTSGASGEARSRRELARLLVIALRRIALSAAEIESLPDTYAQAVRSKGFPIDYDPARPEKAFLPPGLLSGANGWVEIVTPGEEPAARLHQRALGGRSIFRVFLRDPRGENAGRAFLRSLNRSGEHPTSPAPEITPGSQLALVRQAVLVDEHGRLRATPLTLGVELRVLGERLTRVEIEALEERFAGQTEEGRRRLALEMSAQGFFEVHVTREGLLGSTSSGRDLSAGGFRETRRGDAFFVPLEPVSLDPFESGAKPESIARLLSFRPEDRCVGCHALPGIASFRSFNNPAFERHERALFQESTLEAVVAQSLSWKYRRYEWGLLEALWHTGPSAEPETAL